MDACPCICYCRENNHFQEAGVFCAAIWKVFIMSFRSFSKDHANAANKTEALSATAAPTSPAKTAEPAPDPEPAGPEAPAAVPHQGAND